jgi:hypothetical protein
LTLAASPDDFQTPAHQGMRRVDDFNFGRQITSAIGSLCCNMDSAAGQHARRGGSGRATSWRAVPAAVTVRGPDGGQRASGAVPGGARPAFCCCTSEVVAGRVETPALAGEKPDKATFKPSAWEGIATHKPPQSHLKATLEPSLGCQLWTNPGERDLSSRRMGSLAGIAARSIRSTSSRADTCGPAVRWPPGNR